MQRVVLLCGGRGTGSTLRGFLERDDCRVTAVFNPYDDGKSTGEIRRIFDMPGPSDLRKLMECMLPKDHVDAAAFKCLFEFRFSPGTVHDEAVDHLIGFASGDRDLLPDLKIRDVGVRWVLRRLVGEFITGLTRHQFFLGARLDFGDCSLMNCIIAGAFEILGRDFDGAAAMLGRLFELRGRVLPTSGEDLRLVAIRENDDVLLSEAEIVTSRSPVSIREIFLVKEYPDRQMIEFLPGPERLTYLRSIDQNAQATPSVLSEIAAADIILYGPGTQHSSLYPTYRTLGIADAICKNLRALKVLVTNIAPDVDIPEYTAADIVDDALRYLSADRRRRRPTASLIDHVLVNLPPTGTLASLTLPDLERLKGLVPNVMAGRFEDPRRRGTHDGRQVVEACLEVLRGSLV